MSLSAQHRLRHRRDFAKVYRHGAKYSSQHLVIRALEVKSQKGKSQKGKSRPVQFQETDTVDTRTRPLSIKRLKPLSEKQRPANIRFSREDGDRRSLHLACVSSGTPSNSPANRPGGPPTQVGISISQKVSKRAVIRNRIKRQLKAAIRSLLPHLKAGWLLVIVVRPSAVECDYWQFLQELEQTLKTIEVLNGHS